MPGEAPSPLLACYSAFPDHRPPRLQIHSSQFPLFPLLEALRKLSAGPGGPGVSTAPEPFGDAIGAIVARQSKRFGDVTAVHRISPDLMPAEDACARARIDL